ncbi:MAG: prepilin-type N-terminal cleavage/methylation domain-containing protein [Bacilli bacterium]
MENKEEINVKKKKKAFTLIELLAIIVILAIIAVITVPIILNIIENSKKGAATDSALGFKDAVNKAYIQELVKPDNGNLKLNGNYTVQSNALVPSTDNTFGFGVTNYNSLPVDVSGDKPSSGTLTYSNNVLTSGCLVIGDYAVTFNGNETSTVKGTCSSSEQGSTTPTTVKPVIYASKGDTDTKNASEIAVGDYVKLGDNDGFYVINPNKDGKVVLMSEYNISNTASDSSDSTTTGYNAQNNGIMLMSNKTELALADAYRQDTSDKYDQPAFSEEYYWSESFATSSDCSATYCPLYSSESYAFIYDSNSNLYASMQNYKTHLEGIIGTGKISKIRPMSYDEADSIISNSWAYTQSYWLGSFDDNEFVWCVDSSGDLHSDNYYHSNYQGVRPVIEILTSAF